MENDENKPSEDKDSLNDLLNNEFKSLIKEFESASADLKQIRLSDKSKNNSMLEERIVSLKQKILNIVRVYQIITGKKLLTTKMIKKLNEASYD